MTRSTRALSLALSAGMIAWALQPVAGQGVLGSGLALQVNAGPATFGVDVDDPIAAFDFDDMVYGITLTRRGFFASVQIGQSDSGNALIEGDLDLYDVNLAVYGSLFQDRFEGKALEVPIMLFSTVRRIRRDDGNSQFSLFEYTGVGLGTGLGIDRSGDRVSLRARATPGIGLATRSFSLSNGRTIIFDGDVEMATGPVLGRFGIAVGYSYRWQEWRVAGPSSFANEDKLTYDGASHMLRVGMTW